MKLLVVYMNDCLFCLTELVAKLRVQGWHVQKVERYKFKPADVRGKDLIVVLAGDGTFLKTSHMVDSTPMIGVNATPNRRIGFFCRATMKNVVDKINAWQQGKLKPLMLHRLEGVITSKGKKISTLRALNEFFVGCSRPFHVSRYLLSINGKKEYQKSSGIIVGTAAGSHAWLLNSGGKRLPLSSKKMQYVTREPVQSRIVRMRMLKGVLSTRSMVTITSDISDGIVAVDSYPKAYKLPKQASITITSSKKPLYVLG